MHSALISIRLNVFHHATVPSAAHTCTTLLHTSRGTITRGISPKRVTAATGPLHRHYTSRGMKVNSKATPTPSLGLLPVPPSATRFTTVSPSPEITQQRSIHSWALDRDVHSTPPHPVAYPHQIHPYRCIRLHVHALPFTQTPAAIHTAFYTRKNGPCHACHHPTVPSLPLTPQLI